MKGNRIRDARRTDFNDTMRLMREFCNKEYAEGDPLVRRTKFAYDYVCYIKSYPEGHVWDSDEEFDEAIKRYEAGETVEGLSTYTKHFDIVVSVHNEPAKNWWSADAEAILSYDGDKWISKVKFIARDKSEISDMLWGVAFACSDYGRHHSTNPRNEI